jgi:hypothetical protein
VLDTNNRAHGPTSGTSTHDNIAEGANRHDTPSQ